MAWWVSLAVALRICPAMSSLLETLVAKPLLALVMAVSMGRLALLPMTKVNRRTSWFSSKSIKSFCWVLPTLATPSVTSTMPVGRSASSGFRARLRPPNRLVPPRDWSCMTFSVYWRILFGVASTKPLVSSSARSSNSTIRKRSPPRSLPSAWLTPSPRVASLALMEPEISSTNTQSLPVVIGGRSSPGVMLSMKVPRSLPGAL